MSPYTEKPNENRKVEPSARLTEHPYYEAVLDWCQERKFKTEEETEPSRNDITVLINFYDSNENRFVFSFRIYEVNTLFFWVGVEIGTVTAGTRNVAHEELNRINRDAWILYRVGMEERNAVVVNYRGEVEVLNIATFKRTLSDIVDSAITVKELLVVAGVEFQRKCESPSEIKETKKQGANNEPAK